MYGSYKEDVNITRPCSEKLTIQDLTRGSNRRAVGWMQGEKGKKMQLNQLGVSVRSVPECHWHLEMRFGGGGGGGERERELALRTCFRPGGSQEERAKTPRRTGDSWMAEGAVEGAQKAVGREGMGHEPEK